MGIVLAVQRARIRETSNKMTEIVGDATLVGKPLGTLPCRPTKGLQSLHTASVVPPEKWFKAGKDAVVEPSLHMGGSPVITIRSGKQAIDASAINEFNVLCCSWI